MAKEFTSDFKIASPMEYKEKATLALSTSGDIIFVDGKSKLSEQILRAVVNEQTAIRGMLNSPVISTRSIQTLFSIILRDFKQNQVTETKKSDPNFSGFSIFRKAAGSTENYVRVSPNTVTTSFIDTGLVNGVTYNYGISKIYKGIYETTFYDQFSIVPYRTTEQWQLVMGKYACISSGNSQATVYVDYNRNFKASELLDTIVGIYVKQQTDPRGYTVDVAITDMQGNKVSISSQRLEM